MTTYAALILHGDGAEITAANIAKLISATGAGVPVPRPLVALLPVALPLVALRRKRRRRRSRRRKRRTWTSTSSARLISRVAPPNSHTLRLDQLLKSAFVGFFLR